MFPLPERFLRPEEFELIRVGVTALQKVVFVLYFAASWWNGTFYGVYDGFLMPDKPGSNWLYFFHGDDLEGCDCFIHIVTRHRCIKLLFINDDTNLYTAASKLSKFSKCHYLIITRTFKFLAPIVLQLSLIVIPVSAVVILMALARKIVLYLGYEGWWSQARLGLQRFPTRSVFQSKKIQSFLCLVIGFLIVSTIVCLCTTSWSNLQTECETPMCLYCYPRLMHTIFKQKINDCVDIQVTRILFMFTKCLYSLVFSLLLFVVTVVLCCIFIYMVIDSGLSICEVLSKIYSHLSELPAWETVVEVCDVCLTFIREIFRSPPEAEQDEPRSGGICL